MIGILGGTFDPVHNAHLAMARAALESLSLKEILFVPTGTPLYRNPPVASAQHRLAMLKLAIQGEPRYRIDERELAPGASGYTADTLKSLRSEIGSAVALYLLMGADQYAALATSHRPDEVKKLSRIAVFARPGFKAAGKEMNAAMLAIGADMSNQQVADVLTYVRNSWGNKASIVTPEQVAKIRAELKGRTDPHTQEELLKLPEAMP